MLYFIVNTNSRSGEGQKIWNDVRSILDQRNIPYQCRLTKHVGHAAAIASEFTRNADREHPVHLAVLGGDGTIHEALSGIRDLESVVFGFIPAGSGNDFCRGMGIPEDPVRALSLILEGKEIRRMDVPLVRMGEKTRRFGISTGIGYDAAVCQEINSSGVKKTLNRLHLGKLAYVLIALKQMIFCTPTVAEITLDSGRKYSFRKLFFAAVMNQKYEGGGFMFCPEARTDDGVLDIIAVEGMSRLQMLFALPTAFWGGHTRIKGVHIYRSRTAQIRCVRSCAIHVDGETKGPGKNLAVRIEPAQIKIIVPHAERS